MGKFHVLDHPLIQHKLTMIRQKDCGTKVFREVVNEISMLMAYEVSRDLPLEDVEIETPLVKTTLKTLAGKKVAIIPILRAGLGMVDGILELIPAAKIGHVKFCCLVAAPEGVEVLRKAHPDIDIYAAALDERLNEHGYILPGLGDAGDRLFGTK